MNASTPPPQAEAELANVTLQEYIESQLGVQTLPLPVVVPITVLYALISATGIVGNVVVCMVIAKHPNMHTATNYYLFSLAVADVTILVFGLPNDLYVYWHQYPWELGEGLCKFRALISEATSYASVLTIVAFSTERYLAICHPLHAYTMTGLRRATRIIAAIWIVSLGCAVPFAIFTTINYLDFPPGSGNLVTESAFCGMLSVPDNFPLYETSSVVFFLLPMVVLVVLYTQMGLLITRRHGLGESHRTNSSRKSILRMLAAVVVSFFVCWAPFHLQRLLFVYLSEMEDFNEYNEWIYHITGCFYYFSSTVNPILYNLMSAKYRNAFRATLCGAAMPSGVGAASGRETSMAASKREEAGAASKRRRHQSASSGSSWLSRRHEQRQQSASSRVRVTLLLEAEEATGGAGCGATTLEPIVLIVQKNAPAGANGRRLLAAVAEAAAGADEAEPRMRGPSAPDLLANTADSAV